MPTIFILYHVPLAQATVPNKGQTFWLPIRALYCLCFLHSTPCCSAVTTKKDMLCSLLPEKIQFQVIISGEHPQALLVLACARREWIAFSSTIPQHMSSLICTPPPPVANDFGACKVIRLRVLKSRIGYVFSIQMLIL